MACKGRRFIVEVPDLAGVTGAQWLEYLRDAIGGWRGGFTPEDPLFDLKREDVAVRRCSCGRARDAAD
ncbi:hypothetical protein IB275_30405 [Pseudomonas sp. PDM21]|uniref:hypothetical protein n=1 Tax=Pseudomonas sp. PDM21 TaxID=2769257 RepID=UPI00177EFF8B|nr:hypothetical protein [Pseudomonas sp. PDM21]MBD9674928.1 hypothetical protein [Pseudomonas sp. PDM21]